MQPDEAWTATATATAGDQDSVNWLVNGTMLPKIVPDARIMRYDYESSWFGAEASHHRVTALSKRFLLALKRKRKVLLFSAHPHFINKTIVVADYLQDISHTAHHLHCSLLWRLGHRQGQSVIMMSQVTSSNSDGNITVGPSRCH